MKELIKKVVSLQKDKVLHFLLGYFAFYTGIALGKLFWGNCVLVVGLASSAIVGILKEILDSRNRGSVEMKDFIATFLGGLVEFLFRSVL